MLDPEVSAFYRTHELEFYQDFFKLKSFQGWNDFTPYPYQRPAIQCRDNLQAWLWPRRAGKTTVVAAKAVYAATIDDYQRIIVISPRQSQSDRIIRFAKDFINNSPYKDIWLDPKPVRWSTTELMFSNNSGLVSLPEGEGAISALGEGGDLVIIDEVGRLKDARESIAVIQPIIFDRLGTLILISTSWGRSGKGRFWFEICSGSTYSLSETDIIQVMKDQKKVLPEDVFKEKDDLLSKIREDMGEFLYNMQFMNSFEGGTDTVFDFTRVKDACGSADTKKNVNLICCDLGMSKVNGDQSVIALCHVSSGGLDVIRWVGSQQPYQVIQQRLVEYSTNYCCNNIIIDGNTGTSVLEYLLSKGIEAQGIYFTNTQKIKRWRDKGVKYISINKNKTVHRTAQLFNDHKIKLPESDFKVINEFGDYSAIITDAGNVSYRHVKGGHDDYVDVILFAVGVAVGGRDTKILR